MLGILLIDKPSGMTSHDVVDRVRRAFGTRRVGHAGTLDPLATGLLVVAVGPATRFLQYLALEPKTYEGELQFGQSSTTYDREGDLSLPLPLPPDLESRLNQILPKYRGLIQQLPPLYSAVKVQGKPLYRYARQGQDAPRPSRSVHIDSVDLMLGSAGRASFRVVCSGGTYVRTLADDLGREAGCGAFLYSLRRTDAGRFSLEQAHPVDAISPAGLIPLAEALAPMTMIRLNATQAEAIRQGRRIGAGRPLSDRWVGLLDPDGGLIGVAQVEGMELQPECVLPLEAVHGQS